MRVTTLKLENYRAFESMEPIELENINVLIGRNNAGKSSIVRALHCMQSGSEEA
jgi:predicted ATPase